MNSTPGPGLTSELAKRNILNLGCGRKRVAEAVNLDVVADTHPDLVHDLNRLPWPLPDNHFREVLAYDVVEHLDNLVACLEEIHRVCGEGAVIRITTPHFSCANAYTDPTHRHAFGWFSFDYFTGEHEFSFYTQCHFRTLHRQLIFRPSLVNKLVWRFANRHPECYEQRWAWLFPAWYLCFELQVIKPPS